MDGRTGVDYIESDRSGSVELLYNAKNVVQ